jgi:hypothetical protein
MSYDVDIDRWDGNYTSNMREFFVWAFETDDHFKGYHQKPASELLIALRKAIRKIEDTPAVELERFNAQNGWGDVKSATKFLREMAEACEEARMPTHPVYVSW